jgi:hypothetical protein
MTRTFRSLTAIGTAVAATTIPLILTTVAQASPIRQDPWDLIAHCESGGNWNVNTGNDYYGNLQFSLNVAILWRWCVRGHRRPRHSLTADRHGRESAPRARVESLGHLFPKVGSGDDTLVNQICEIFDESGQGLRQ